MSNKSDDILEEYSNKEYEFGFVTDIEMEVAPKGLSEETIHFISNKKGEPQWLLDWRLKAYQSFLKQPEPHWQNFELPKVDFQDISYYAAPKSQAKYKSIDEVDPELISTFEKLGIPLSEQKILAGVAVDAVFDSVSVVTTFKETLKEHGVIFSS